MGIKSRYERIINPKARNRGYWGYSDALDSQFVISTYKDVTEKYASATKDLIADSLKDLKEDLLITFGLDERFQGDNNNEKWIY